VAALLVLTGVLGLAYAAVATYAATQLVRTSRMPITQTPADLGLAYQNVSFHGRDGGPLLKGWFIPGVLPNGHLTAQRTIIMCHGNMGNRMDPTVGILDISAQLVRNGYAVLTFDQRGFGQSPDALNSYGYYPQYDVLGAVDFLRSGPISYPQLGRPAHIAGWGVSLGSISLMLAAAKEPAIEAVVADSPYPDMAPILEREIPKQGHLPQLIVPGTFLADQILYGINFYKVRPVDVVAKIAPRPILFIMGDHDDFDPPSNLPIMVAAANQAPNANVQSWLAPGVYHHARSYKVNATVYIQRLLAFYGTALGPDSGA
jgi:pimeloyl-ACP methyl ester carboxylesterase